MRRRVIFPRHDDRFIYPFTTKEEVEMLAAKPATPLLDSINKLFKLKGLKPIANASSWSSKIYDSFIAKLEAKDEEAISLAKQHLKGLKFRTADGMYLSF